MLEEKPGYPVAHSEPTGHRFINMEDPCLPMIEPFVYASLPARVLFGAGRIAEIPEEMRRLGCTSPVLLSTPAQRNPIQQVADCLGTDTANIFAHATMHTPVAVTEQALAFARDRKADCIVAIGGGSTIGLGKAMALRTDLPQIVVPTTYAGSEMTPILGETSAGQKTTQRSLKVLPETVIYDVDLTLSLLPVPSANSGMNALAHAVEALYARDRNPIISLMAEEAITAFTQSLPQIVAQPLDRAARTRAQYAALLCGACLGAVGMGLHHKLCHVVGGAFNLPHAETHAVLLPHVVAYNAQAAPEAMQRIARALGTRTAVHGLYDFAGRLGVPRSLRDIGMPLDGIERAATLAVKDPYWNPRPIEIDAIRNLLDRALRGASPLD